MNSRFLHLHLSGDAEDVAEMLELCGQDSAVQSHLKMRVDVLNGGTRAAAGSTLHFAQRVAFIESLAREAHKVADRDAAPR